MRPQGANDKEVFSACAALEDDGGIQTARLEAFDERRWVVLSDGDEVEGSSGTQVSLRGPKIDGIQVRSEVHAHAHQTGDPLTSMPPVR